MRFDFFPFPGAGCPVNPARRHPSLPYCFNIRHRRNGFSAGGYDHRCRQGRDARPSGLFLGTPCGCFDSAFLSGFHFRGIIASTQVQAGVIAAFPAIGIGFCRETIPSQKGAAMTECKTFGTLSTQPILERWAIQPRVIVRAASLAAAAPIAKGAKSLPLDRFRLPEPGAPPCWNPEKTIEGKWDGFRDCQTARSCVILSMLD